MKTLKSILEQVRRVRAAGVFARSGDFKSAQAIMTAK